MTGRTMPSSQGNGWYARGCLRKPQASPLFSRWLRRLAPIPPDSKVKTPRIPEGCKPLAGGGASHPRSARPQKESIPEGSQAFNRRVFVHIRSPLFRQWSGFFEGAQILNGLEFLEKPSAWEK
jgi:hypothetical protein